MTSTTGNASNLPVPVKHFVLTLLSIKLKVAFEDLTGSKTIKQLCGGRSAVQNEIIADMQTEFGSVPNGAEEMSLDEISSKIPSDNYKGPGKVFKTPVQQLYFKILPGGVTVADMKQYIKSKWSCSNSQVIEAIIVHGLTVNAKDRLTDKVACERFIDQLVQSYANKVGVQLTDTFASNTTAPVQHQAASSVAIQMTSTGPLSIPVSIKHFLFVLLSTKLKIPFKGLTGNNTIKQLSGGRSAVQNEIIADIQSEFSSVPNSAEDISLDELSNKLNASNYACPGKVFKTPVSQYFAKILPGGMNTNDIKQYYKAKWNCNDINTLECIVTHALTWSSVERLADKSAVERFADQLLQSYASAVDYKLDMNSASQSSTISSSTSNVYMPIATVQTTGISQDLKNYLKKSQRLLTTLLDDVDGKQILPSNSNSQNTVLPNIEHSEDFMQLIQPIFEQLKIRKYGNVRPWHFQKNSAIIFKQTSYTNYVKIY